MPILSDNTSASSKWCVVNTMVRYSYLNSIKIYHIALLLTGSMPDVGSSKNITFDPPKIAIAKESLRLFPPDKFFTVLPLSESNAHFKIY